MDSQWLVALSPVSQTHAGRKQAVQEVLSVFRTVALYEVGAYMRRVLDYQGSPIPSVLEQCDVVRNTYEQIWHAMSEAHVQARNHSSFALYAQTCGFTIFGAREFIKFTGPYWKFLHMRAGMPGCKLEYVVAQGIGADAVIGCLCMDSKGDQSYVHTLVGGLTGKYPAVRLEDIQAIREYPTAVLK